ncbi:MAG: glycosyltransferase [Hyphomicrobiaceae bacterium]
MMTFLLEAFIVLAGVVIVYHHFVYPALVNRLAERKRRRGGSPRAPHMPDEALPHFTVIVPAYNEEAFIAAKIRDLASLDYPSDKVRIIIALDGSTDRTREFAEKALKTLGNQSRIELRVFPRNRGKVAVLNQCIGEAEATDLVALTDVSTTSGPHALRRAAAQFADARVGVVFATYALTDAGSEGERVYTLYQTQLRFDEATLDPRWAVTARSISSAARCGAPCRPTRSTTTSFCR